MATTGEVATKALKRLAIISPGETPSAAELSDATDALNAMIASWTAKGLSNDTLPLSSAHEAGVIAMLAVRIAEDYGKTPGPVLARDAEAGWKALQGAFFMVGSSNNTKCPTCGGQTTINGGNTVCPTCNGTGIVSSQAPNYTQEAATILTPAYYATRGY